VAAQASPEHGPAGRRGSDRTVVLFVSGPEEQKLRFQGADHFAALRGPFRLKTKRTRPSPRLVPWVLFRWSLGRRSLAGAAVVPFALPVRSRVVKSSGGVRPGLGS
jgi:hypothetical protein